jgi:hypothetical protein
VDGGHLDAFLDLGAALAGALGERQRDIRRIRLAIAVRCWLGARLGRA